MKEVEEEREEERSRKILRKKSRWNRKIERGGITGGSGWNDTKKYKKQERKENEVKRNKIEKVQMKYEWEDKREEG